MAGKRRRRMRLAKMRSAKNVGKNKARLALLATGTTPRIVTHSRFTAKILLFLLVSFGFNLFIGCLIFPRVEMVLERERNRRE